MKPIKCLSALAGLFLLMACVTVASEATAQVPQTVFVNVADDASLSALQIETAHAQTKPCYCVEGAEAAQWLTAIEAVADTDTVAMEELKRKFLTELQARAPDEPTALNSTNTTKPIASRLYRDTGHNSTLGLSNGATYLVNQSANSGNTNNSLFRHTGHECPWSA